MFLFLLLASRKYSDKEHIHQFSEEFAVFLGGCLSTTKLKGEKKNSAELNSLF